MNTTCIICYEKCNYICWKCKTCRNTLHHECMEKWYKKSRTCPYCRTNVRYISNTAINKFIIVIFICAVFIKIKEIILSSIYEDPHDIYEYQCDSI